MSVISPKREKEEKKKGERKAVELIAEGEKKKKSK